ncbi:monooxygenase [Saccharibacillus brassicae]|uniref:Monooxygenase n=1 Tax=Saccharibacillus brassicae TaxID=2583377 RepID=A0A4Y6UWE8_SACBS|nr:monooxygenase [Saccharibacillus brassicae]QDH21434.1 monooxygenase [Saccharibacillus brassicae]
MSVILQIDFEYAGPYGDEMAEAFREMAESINEAPGFRQKIWTENASTAEAGGIYLFDTEANAASYRDFHLRRLAGFGIDRANAKIFAVNRRLSAINHFDL